MVPCCGARTWPLIQVKGTRTRTQTRTQTQTRTRIRIQEDVNLSAPTDSGNTDLSDLGEEDLANLAKDEQVTTQQTMQNF